MSNSSTPTTAEVHPFPNAKAPSAEAPSAPVESAAAAPAKKKRSVRSLLLPIIGLGLVGTGLWYGYGYWTDGRFMISTDDAYVQADMAFVSPKVSGYIDEIKVENNQQVKAGDPLFIVDSGDYRIAVDQAAAQIATLDKTLVRIDAQITAAHASLQQAEAQKNSAQAAADNAQRTQGRTAQLLKTHVATQAQLDDAQTAVDQTRASLASADAQIAAAKANIGVLEAQRAESASTQASLRLTKDKAERDLGFTVLRAPYDGVVGNRSVEKGNLVSPGQKLAAIVPLNKLYIVANFKETQLARLVPGETVRIAVDALHNETFEGTVSSLAPASGAVFSMLPPENATGNFTKVVQRVPVRIDVSPEALATGRLRAGLSVIVDVDSRTAPSATTK
ncbi:HlyD family secretion protein [Mesorhizobium sp. UC22_110]|uniref:HlyD family secretion protein n=1 Tax=unclassified Mesorhizobium TaxID=325217 RepID=UPI00366A6DE4